MLRGEHNPKDSQEFHKGNFYHEKNYKDANVHSACTSMSPFASARMHLLEQHRTSSFSVR